MTSKFDAPSYDVVVVGGSQAGLAVGYHLKQRGLRFVILDAACPSRLLAALPPQAPVLRCGLAEAIAETRRFLVNAPQPVEN